jgi:tetratricopeptide (TPR) repeat protein
VKYRAGFLAVIFLTSLDAQRTTKRQPATTDGSITSIEAGLRKDPKDAGLRNELAGAYLQKLRESGEGSYLERASRIVDDLLGSDPSNYEARRHRLAIEMQRHHFREALALANVLGRERPDDTVVWGLLGDAQLELGDYDAAERAYQKMVDLRPSMSSYSRAAFFRFVTGDAEGAIALMRQAIRMGSPAAENTAWCLADLGNMLFKTGAIDEAEKTYRESLAAYSGYHPAWAGIGRVLAARERYKEAVEAFHSAQTRVPLPEYAASLAKLHRLLGDAAQEKRQIAMLDLADTLDKAAGEAANRSLALALADLDHKPARALELATAELEVRRDVYTYDALAWALFKNGKNDEAAEAMRKALSQNTPEPAFHEHAARIYEALGLSSEARQQRERMAALNPRFELR